MAKILPKTNLESWHLPKHPLERVLIDIVGPLDTWYYFILIDAFSNDLKYFKLSRYRQQLLLTVSKILFHNIEIQSW